MAVVGEATVLVRADTAGVEGDILTAFGKAAPAARAAGEQAAAAFGKAGEQGGEEFSENLERGVKRESGTKSKWWGELGKTFASSLVGGFASVGATEVASMVKHFAQVGVEIESIGKKAGTVFEESTAQVKTWADQNAASFGLTSIRLQGLAANFGDLLKPMGFTATEAAKMSTEVVGLAGALAAWSGGQYTAQQASDILAKAMLGERDALKGLGIAISEADVSARLALKGQEDLTGAALEQAKAVATQELIFEKSADAQRAWSDGSMDAVKSQNALQAKTAEVQETLAEFANKVLPVLVEALGAAFKVAGPLIDVFSAIPKPVLEVAATLATIGGAVYGFHKAFSAAGDAVAAVGKTLTKWSEQAASATQKVGEMGSASVAMTGTLAAVSVGVGVLTYAWMKHKQAQAEAKALTQEMTQVLEEELEKFGQFTGALSNVKIAKDIVEDLGGLGKKLRENNVDLAFFSDQVRVNGAELDKWREAAGRASGVGDQARFGYDDLSKKLRAASESGSELATRLLALVDTQTLSKREVGSLVVEMDKLSDGYDRGVTATLNDQYAKEQGAAATAAAGAANATAAGMVNLFAQAQNYSAQAVTDSTGATRNALLAYDQFGNVVGLAAKELSKEQQASDIAKAAADRLARAVADQAAAFALNAAPMRTMLGYMEGLTKAADTYWDSSFRGIDAQSKLLGLFADAGKALADNGQGFDLNTEAGRKNYAMLEDLLRGTNNYLIGLYQANGASKEWFNAQADIESGLITVMQAMGMSQDEIAKWIKAWDDATIKIAEDAYQIAKAAMAASGVSMMPPSEEAVAAVAAWQSYVDSTLGILNDAKASAGKHGQQLADTFNKSYGSTISGKGGASDTTEKELKKTEDVIKKLGFDMANMTRVSNLDIVRSFTQAGLDVTDAMKFTAEKVVDLWAAGLGGLDAETKAALVDMLETWRGKLTQAEKDALDAGQGLAQSYVKGFTGVDIENPFKIKTKLVIDAFGNIREVAVDSAEKMMEDYLKYSMIGLENTSAEFKKYFAWLKGELEKTGKLFPELGAAAGEMAISVKTAVDKASGAVGGLLGNKIDDSAIIERPDDPVWVIKHEANRLARVRGEPEPFPGFASGGRWAAGEWAMVGERGPEIARLGVNTGGADVFSNDTLRETLAGLMDGQGAAQPMAISIGRVSGDAYMAGRRFATGFRRELVRQGVRTRVLTRR